MELALSLILRICRNKDGYTGLENQSITIINGFITRASGMHMDVAVTSGKIISLFPSGIKIE